ncbi:MAG: hypothetical protein PHH30_07980 [Bacteroidales bacterium]|nr:hypothetical protein [Bacteroidales bacterium]MDD3860183.1 hypothetical protein [Bacteroidales bacterium]
MRSNIVIIILITCLIVMNSCNKYEEGPFISLRSVEKRIAGDYTLDKYLINGQIISLADQGISEYRVVYNSDGTGTSFITVNSSTLETEFEWELDEKKENIRERSKGINEEWSAWSNYKTILKLTDSEFWFADTDSAEQTEFHFAEN